MRDALSIFDSEHDQVVDPFRTAPHLSAIDKRLLTSLGAWQTMQVSRMDHRCTCLLPQMDVKELWI